MSAAFDPGREENIWHATESKAAALQKLIEFSSSSLVSEGNPTITAEERMVLGDIVSELGIRS